MNIKFFSKEEKDQISFGGVNVNHIIKNYIILI